MATKKTQAAESHSHAKLEAELAALKKEVAALKKQCAAGGGSDPRFDKFLEAFRGYSSKWRNILEKAGL